jgi:hypothetical protein
MADSKRGILDAGVERNASPYEAVGAPGVAVYGGYIVESEKDKSLTGREKYRTYSNNLANIAIVAAGVRFFLSIVAKAQWTVDPADDSSEAEEIAEKVQRSMEMMTTPWHRIVRRAAMSRFYGFSVQEWTLVRDEEEGWIRYLDIEPRPQLTIERWDLDDSGTVLGVMQRDPQDQSEIYLPRPKLIYVVDDTLNDSPEGLGLFRHIARVANRLERYELLEGWGYERDLRGTPIGRGPLAELARMQDNGELTAAQVEELRRPIETWVRNALKGKDTALLLDSSVYRGTGEQQTPSSSPQWDISLLQGDGGPHEEIASAIERCNREIARILGVEHLLLGSDSTGSFAMSQDKSKNFALLVDSTLVELRATFERDYLDPLFEFNGWPKKLKPSFKIEQVQHRDLEVLSSVLRDVATAGAPLAPNDPAINAIRELAGLPDAPEEDLSLPLSPLAETEVPETDLPEVEEESDDE